MPAEIDYASSLPIPVGECSACRYLRANGKRYTKLDTNHRSGWPAWAMS